jgi:hypothetical protein
MRTITIIVVVLVIFSLSSRFRLPVYRRNVGMVLIGFIIVKSWMVMLRIAAGSILVHSPNPPTVYLKDVRKTSRIMAKSKAILKTLLCLRATHSLSCLSKDETMPSSSFPPLMPSHQP